MQEMMRRLVLLVLLLGAADLNAVCVDFGFDALYLKPQHCPFIMGFRSDTTSVPGTTIQTSYPMGTHYHWAKRVRLNAEQSCYGAQISYLWYKSNDPARRQGGALAAPLFTSTGDLITGVIRLNYQNIDVRFVRSFTTPFCDTIDFFINGRWLELGRVQLIDLFNGGNFVSEEKRLETFRGGAVGLGLRFDTCLWRSFSGFVTFNPMVAIGERRDKSNTNGLFAPFSIPLELQPATALLPGCDGQIGLRVAYSACNVRLEGHVGYEINHYWNVFPGEVFHIAGLDETRAAMNCDPMGFAGIFFGINATY